MKKLAWLFVLGIITGCSVTAKGPEFNEANLKKSDNPTIVVYRPDNNYASAIGFNVGINDVPSCDLHNNSFFIRQPTGSTTITSTLWGAPGTSRITIQPKKKSVVYVRLDIDESKRMAGQVGGLIGQLIAEGASSTGGPFILTQVDPDQAKDELEGLHQDCI